MWLRKNLKPRLKYKQKFIWKVTEVEEVSCGGSEAPGLHGLRKQVTEAKEGPWNLGERKAKRHTYREKVQKSRERNRERERWKGRGKGRERAGPFILHQEGF